MTLLSRRGLFAGAAGTLALPRRRRPVGMKPDQEGVFFQVTVIGTNGGVFVYDSSGNLVASIADTANVDPLTHSNNVGIVSYLPGTPSDFAQLLAGHLNLHALTETQSGSIGENLPGVLAIASGEQSMADALAEIFLFSKAAAGASGPVVLVNGSSPNTGAALEVRGSLAVGPSLGNIREWYAPSGGDDFAALNTALSSYGSADLLPGAYSLSAKLIVTGAALQGCDMATAIQPFGGYAGALLQCGSQGSIRNLGIQNGGTDAIVVPGGAAEWWLEDLLFSSNAGSCINATITGPAHGRIRGIRGLGGGTANGGGIRLDGGTGASVTAEVNLYDIDIQNCTASEILFCSAVTDIRCDGPLNGAIKSGVASNGITIQGACQSIDLGSIDIGGGSGTDGVLAIKAAGGNSPTEIQAGPGVVQSSGAAVGVLVSDSSARIWLDRIMSKRNHFDGFAWTGTGAFNRMSGCGGNLNNQAGGTAYDVNVTSSAHILNDGFSYVSGSTVAGRNISIVGNHYTEANPPSSLTSAGQAPAGW